MGSHDFISCHVCITSYYFQDRLTSTQKCVQIYQDVAANLTESSESLLCFCFSKLYFRNIIHVASCPLTNKREHNFKISLFLHLFLSGCACLYILVNIYIYIYSQDQQKWYHHRGGGWGCQGAGEVETDLLPQLKNILGNTEFLYMPKQKVC